jgi:hypothetical protein
MADPPPKRVGCIISLALFIFLGLPLWGMMLLGERRCDMHIGPPCSISWELMKLINGLAIVAACLAFGWLVSGVIEVARKNNPPDDTN